MSAGEQRYKHHYDYKKIRKIRKKSNKVASFGYQSALIIALSAALASIFLPYLFSFFYTDIKIVTLLSCAILISFSVCYCHCFIETKKGFGKLFLRLFICFFIAISIICYFWLYIGLYM